MPKPKTIEDHINLAINTWGHKEMEAFFSDVFPLLELFNVDEARDWVRDDSGEENFRNVRLIRSMYLISKIAEFHAGPLVSFKTKLPKLYKKLEDAVKKMDEDEKRLRMPQQLDFFNEIGGKNA